MKRSAGIFVYGVGLTIAGYVILGGSVAALNSAARSYYGDTATPGVWLWVGGLVSLVGSILTLLAMYRALQKIDALPLEAERASADAQAGGPIA